MGGHRQIFDEGAFGYFILFNQIGVISESLQLGMLEVQVVCLSPQHEGSGHRSDENILGLEVRVQFISPGLEG